MSTLLQHYAQLQSQDLRYVREHVSEVLCPHRLSLAGGGQSLETALFYRQGDSLGFGRLSYGAQVTIEPEPFQNFYLLQVPIRGKEEIHLHQGMYASNAQAASLLSPNQVFSMSHSEEADKLFVRIARQGLEAHYRQYFGQTHRGVLEFFPIIRFDEPKGQTLWRLLCWQFNEASEGLMLDSPSMRACVEETLMTALLELLAHNQPLRDERRQAAPAAIRRAIEYMEAHVTEPLVASDIAKYAGLSTRSLYAGFRAGLGQTPMVYLKSLRLKGVRQALLEAAGGSASVTDLAMAWGFGHLGQFAADYRAQFGELPSQTLQGGARRLRSGATHN
ncbi:helix-turn-helix domain-containing protein [Pusillimonas sp. CC-YST705]|uniref:Helix-turn-helix domain-containing protein n=1 Tax=Mesopusillimonas faecipullorum TaxID=2755040 RepID=A0ABS8CF40_9BURK|nr:helix-turn-helix domain-containing protein [Mesopusillimonas faecipullorum]MCB5364670.1 helix-turn-helix domain-containing protein [Mesopusillimonas faecipullorum]